MYSTLIPNRLYNLTGASISSDGFSLNTFALVKDNLVLLMDAVLPVTFPAVNKLLEDNPTWKIGGAILSHRHVAGIARRSGFERFFHAFGDSIPLILPDFESQNEEAMLNLPEGKKYIDPANSDIVQHFGLSVIKFPGHTEAHPWYTWDSEKVLMVGDCAVGPTPNNPNFSRPPQPFSWDDEILKRSWVDALNKGLGDVRTICAFHGGSVINEQPDKLANMLKPLAI